MQLPTALQQMLAHAHQSLVAPEQHSLDPEVVLAIGSVFGTLSGAPPGINAVQRRHLFLLLLTFRHLVPTLTPHLNHAYPLTQTVADLAQYVYNPLPNTGLDLLTERLEQWVEPTLDDRHPQTLALLCLYTIGKVIESCVTATEIYGYTAEIHSGVALNMAAETYVRSSQSEQPHTELYRRYWWYWLNHIVPKAWYAIPTAA